MGQAAYRNPTVRRIDGKYGIRQEDSRQLVIEYRLPVFEHVRKAAAEGFRALPRGGIEVGGVLFGRHEANLIQITAARELECEHAFGPTFQLSERDEERLRELLDSAAQEPELAGAVPVGWYRSFNRSEARLTERDIDLHNRYFPQPWQTVLVVSPHEGEVVTAAFFLRDADGVLLPDAAASEFELQPVRPDPPAPPRAAEPAPPPRVPAPRSEHVPLTARKEEADEPAPRRRWRPLLLISAAAALFLAGLAVGRWPPLVVAPPASGPAPLGLRLRDTEGQLLVTWERGPASAARRAALEITDDGARTTLPLDPAALGRGSVTYQRHGAKVDVRFVLQPEHGAPVQELASFLGQPPQRAAPPPPASEPAPQSGDTAAENAELRRTVERQKVRIEQLDEAVRVLRRRLQVEESLRRRARKP